MFWAAKIFFGECIYFLNTIVCSENRGIFGDFGGVSDGVLGGFVLDTEFTERGHGGHGGPSEWAGDCWRGWRFFDLNPVFRISPDLFIKSPKNSRRGAGKSGEGKAQLSDCFPLTAYSSSPRLRALREIIGLEIGFRFKRMPPKVICAGLTGKLARLRALRVRAP